MAKKIKLSEKISNSIFAATKLVRTRLTSKPKVVKKPNTRKVGPSVMSRVQKIISNPIVQGIGLNLLELNNRNKLSIYTHNICWTRSKLNHLRIAQKIQSLQPDIVCLQEIVFQAQSEIFNQVHYHKSIAQDSGKRIVKGGLAIYSKVKPICVDFIKFEQQGKIFSPQLAERQLEKGFLVAEFKDYLVINTHLVADQSKKWTEPKLKHTNAQFEQLLEFIQLTKSTKPVFVVGDLNFCPINDSYKKAIESGLIDISTKIPYTYTEKKMKLDYIWSTKSSLNFKSQIPRFTQQEPSDHFAIYSLVKL